MDIFEIKDNLGFDVLWDNMAGKHCPMEGAMLNKLVRIEGNIKKQRENFIKLNLS
jgi:hypothetical protein